MRSSILILPAAIVALVSAQTGPTTTAAPTGITYSNTTSTAAASTGYTTSVVVVGGKTTSVLVNGAGQTSSFRSTVSPTAGLQGSEAGRSAQGLCGALLGVAMGFAFVL